MAHISLWISYRLGWKVGGVAWWWGCGLIVGVARGWGRWLYGGGVAIRWYKVWMDGAWL